MLIDMVAFKGKVGWVDWGSRDADYHIGVLWGEDRHDKHLLWRRVGRGAVVKHFHVVARGLCCRKCRGILSGIVLFSFCKKLSVKVFLFLFSKVLSLDGLAIRVN